MATRISSLYALVAAVAAPIYILRWGQEAFAIATLIIALLVLVAHRDNIKRLLAGTEPRIGKSK